MASIVKRPNGHRWVQFTDGDRKRQTIRLPKCNQRTAEGVSRHVEQLLASKLSGQALDGETARWVATLETTLAEKLAKVGLIDPPEAKDRMKLGPFLEAYIAGRKDVKLSTATVLGHTHRCLVEYFGHDNPLDAITEGDAEAWRVWLATSANIRDGERDGLAANTVARRTGIARQFFNAARRRKLISENPFDGLSAQVRGNRSRQYFVSREETDSLLKAAPDAEWRLIILLARYGGLRIPSELVALRWSDVDLPNRRMVIHASKTAHHESGGQRVCPIFPELFPAMQAAWEAAKPGQAFVIARYRDTNSNLRTQLLRIIHRAGLVPWEKLFQNMRSSRQTELLDRHPIKAVCDWLGNSAPVAMEHYAQTTSAHFMAAIAEPTHGKSEPPQGEADPKQKAKHNPKQSVSEMNGNTLNDCPPAHEKTPVLQGFAEPCSSVQVFRMGDEGLEPPTPSV